MHEPNQNNSSIRDEFRALGEHLKQFVQSAWGSEERKKFQQEIEAGISELGAALNDLAAEVNAGETGQKIRKEVDDFSARLRSGEVEEKTRSEILKALKRLNEELDKATRKFDDDDV